MKVTLSIYLTVSLTNNAHICRRTKQLVIRLFYTRKKERIECGLILGVDLREN